VAVGPAGTGARPEEYRFFGSAGQACLDTALGTLDLALRDGPRAIEPLDASEMNLQRRTSAALVARTLN
jgi:hypothetical protein